ncbi:type II/IV secretion system protein [Ectothiorhodospiraceae bacterium WFHF3C12]|nr:type II/IV secretion system protein [Ectothiorhodospiraceae bacterium WFHF3C12]
MSEHAAALAADTPLRDEAQLERLMHQARTASSRRLGEILVEAGAIDQEQLDGALRALREQRPGDRRHLGQILVERGLVSQRAVTEALCRQFGIPRVRLRDLEIREEILSIVPEEMALRFGVVPLTSQDRLLVIATANPFDEQAMTALRFHTGCTIEPVLADADEIGELQSRYYVADAATAASAELDVAPAHRGHPAANTDPESAARRKPVVKLVMGLLAQAVHRGASDIHVRPDHEHVAIQFRVDGKLRPVRTLQRSLLPAVIARLKIIGGMDVAEHRLPQDGHTRFQVGGKPIDVRLSVMPTMNGESAVLRILDKARGLRDFATLGFTPTDLERLRGIISRPHGLFLVTGPTGSGKSTTLNAMLREIRAGNPHIMTVEDPVEYDQEGIEQIQVHAGIGYTFAEALRHILRHDPDVIMVGEIRDLDTAAIANKAALTGHLVLSTLHTNDAASAVTRLVDMGVEPYLLAGTLLGVMAQRLVRVNCPACRVTESPPQEMRRALGVGTDEAFQVGAGCRHCDHTGVRGRQVVYELLPVTAEISALIHEAPSTEVIHRQAVALGMEPLTQHALTLARRGEVALREVYSIRLR